MQVIRNFQNINKDLQKTTLTIGNFDGTHLGHQAILAQTKKIACQNNLKSALLTFEPHPIKIINPEKYLNIGINNLSQKLNFLRKENLVDIVFVNGFNKQMANLSAEDFVKKILVNTLKIKHLAIGYDFTFGKDRLGNAEMLKKLSQQYQFFFHTIEAKKHIDQQIYSSTQIRKFISDGNIKSTNQMLGRNHQISGVVIKGRQMARQLGFPTANFLPKQNLIKPKFGVYQAIVFVGAQKYKAILNFGTKPTFAGIVPLFEAHIFDFNQIIYNQKIVVELIDFIREERKFNSFEELKNQITKDIFELSQN